VGERERRTGEGWGNVGTSINNESSEV